MIPPRKDNEYIRTFSGKKVWPLNPRVSDIDIKDILHALPNICRFTGHTREFYSVAQHSCLMYLAMAGSMYDDMERKWALLHDASEAYLCDIARPVKQHLAEYKEYEDRLMKVIAKAFNLEWPMPDSVKYFDNVLLATERRDLMNGPVKILGDYDTTPLEQVIVPHPPKTAWIMFHKCLTEAGLHPKVGA